MINQGLIERGRAFNGNKAIFNPLYTYTILPIADNTYDVGSEDYSYRNAHFQTAVYATSVVGDWSPSADDTYWSGIDGKGWKGFHMPDTLVTDDTGYVLLRNNANDAYVGLKTGGIEVQTSTTGITLAGTYTTDIILQGGTTLTDDGTDLTIAGADLVLGTYGVKLASGEIQFGTGSAWNVRLKYGESDTVYVWNTANSYYANLTAQRVNASDWFTNLTDDTGLRFGAPDFIQIYETADADAKIVTFCIDESADSGNNVPVFAFMEYTGATADLGLFDAFSEPLVTVVDNDKDSWFGITFNGDDTPELQCGGAATSIGFNKGVSITTQVVQAFKAEYNISAQQGAWVHGVKVELTRTADIQPATGCWFGGQFVLNAGSSSYTALDKPAYALQAVFKGSDTSPDGVDIHVARFETQSAGKVSDICYITANTGTTIMGSLLYIATHIVPGRAMALLNAQSSVTVPIGLELLSGTGSSYNYGIDMNSATINTADIRFHHGTLLLDDGTDLTLSGANLLLSDTLAINTGTAADDYATLTAYDSTGGTRTGMEAFRWTNNNTTPCKISFFGATPVVKQTGTAVVTENYAGTGDLDTEAELAAAINANGAAINVIRTALNAYALTTTV